MALNFSIKDVPDDVAQALRERAARNHRSLQGELLHLLESAVGPKPFEAKALRRRVAALRFTTADESTAMIREDRDAR